MSIKKIPVLGWNEKTNKEHIKNIVNVLPEGSKDIIKEDDDINNIWYLSSEKIENNKGIGISAFLKKKEDEKNVCNSTLYIETYRYNVDINVEKGKKEFSMQRMSIDIIKNPEDLDSYLQANFEFSDTLKLLFPENDYTDASIYETLEKSVKILQENKIPHVSLYWGGYCQYWA